MYIFAEPMTENQVEAIQSRNERKNEQLTKQLLGIDDYYEDEDDVDPDEDDAAAWSRLRATVSKEISKQQQTDGSHSSLARDTDQFDEELSFEQRLLRMQITAEELKARVEKAKSDAATKQADNEELADLPGIVDARRSEREFTSVLASLYQLESSANALWGEIVEEQGDESQLLFFINHTLDLIKVQIEQVGEHTVDPVVASEGSRIVANHIKDNSLSFLSRRSSAQTLESLQ